MLGLLKKIAENIFSLFQKLKCKMSCCNTEVNVRVVQSLKTPRHSSFNDHQRSD